MHSIGIFVFFTFLDIYFSKCNVYLLRRGQSPLPRPLPFVMTQINEVKRNTLPSFIYAFPKSTANLHSSQGLLPRRLSISEPMQYVLTT